MTKAKKLLWGDKEIENRTESSAVRKGAYSIMARIEEVARQLKYSYCVGCKQIQRPKHQCTGDLA